MSEQPQQHPITKQRVVYDMAGADAGIVQRDVDFRAADGGVLAMDVYRPCDSTTGARVPAVVVAAAYPDVGFQKLMGCRFKEMQSSISWGRLMAASGMAAITYTNRDPEADLYALLEHLRRNAESLGISAHRIGLWASSGNAPLALSALMPEHAASITCAVLCYPYTLDLERTTGVADAAKKFGFINPCAGKSVDDLSTGVPLFVARAGTDQMPGLNDALDRFLARAVARNLPLSFVNHATGPHAFDLFHDSETSREIIRQILAFLRFHLLPAPVVALTGLDTTPHAV
jgi:hypothetical protein